MIKTFELLINTGIEALDMVADAEKKATICAELAKAIAQSGLLMSAGTIMTEVAAPVAVEEEAKKDAKKTSRKSKSAKDALKPEASKVDNEPVAIEEEAPVATPVVVEEEVVQETVEEVTEETVPAQEVEIVDEWTEEMQALKEESLTRLNAYVEAWGEEYVYTNCLNAFSEGAFYGGENVRPSNIDGFVAYLDALAAQFAEQQ